MHKYGYLTDLSLSCFTDEVAVVCTLIEYWLTEILPIQREQKTWCPQIQSLRGKQLWIASRCLFVISHYKRDLQSSCFIVNEFKKLRIKQQQQQFGFLLKTQNDILVYLAFTLIITYENIYIFTHFLLLVLFTIGHDTLCVVPDSMFLQSKH